MHQPSRTLPTLKDLDLLRQELDVWICRYGLSDARDSIHEMARPGIALRPSPGYSPAGARVSHFGGLPVLPQTVEWPTSAGVPMAYLGMLDFERIGPLDATGLLPQSGRLFLWGRLHDFALWSDDWNDGPRFSAVFIEGEADGWTVRRSPWSRADSQEWFGNENGQMSVCNLSPRPRMTVPDIGDYCTDRFRDSLRAMEPDGWALYRNMVEEMRREMGNLAAHQMLGCEPTLQFAVRETDDQVVLLTFDGNSYLLGEGSVAGSGYIHVVMTEQTLRARDFSGITVAAQID